MMTKAHVGHATGNVEWFTPSEIIVAARCVMGNIDLDPATTAMANENVIHADKFFTKADNGLLHDWWGHVWLNPPYSFPLIAKFADKLVNEVKDNRVIKACFLVNNATETVWFQKALASAQAICLIKGRLRFLDAAGKPGAPLQGQAILYFGQDAHVFKHTFKHFGEVLYTGYEPEIYPSSPYFAIGGISTRPSDTGIFGMGYQYDHGRVEDYER